MRRLVPVLSALTLVATAAPALAQQPIYVMRTTNLPIELKDPFTAYSIGLVPFYSIGAAYYVGTTRLQWDPAPALKVSAMTQTLLDLALLGAGLYLTSRSTTEPPATTATFTTGGVAALAAIPLTHLWFYAPFWGQHAVEFNRKRLEQEGFSTSEPK